MLSMSDIFSKRDDFIREVDPKLRELRVSEISQIEKC